MMEANCTVDASVNSTPSKDHPVMQRVALAVSYDGAAWRGWQTQPDGQTVQDCLEQALRQFAGCALPTICAGRTDTGVHAMEQIVHVDAPFVRDPMAWVRGLNSHLPASIAVQWAQPVSANFHARFSALSRHYTYIILNTPQRHPLWDRRAGWCFRPLDAERMQQAASLLIGQHDFSSYRSSQCQAATPVRTMYEVSVQRQRAFIVIQLRANAFLHHMVRNIVGELVYVGQGRTSVSHFENVLKARDRRRAAPTYAAGGLYLTGVEYPAELIQMPKRSSSLLALLDPLSHEP